MWKSGFTYLPLRVCSWNSGNGDAGSVLRCDCKAEAWVVLHVWPGGCPMVSSFAFEDLLGEHFYMFAYTFTSYSFFSGLQVMAKCSINGVFYTGYVLLCSLCYLQIGLPHSKSAFLQHTTAELLQPPLSAYACSLSCIPWPCSSALQLVFPLFKASAIIWGLCSSALIINSSFRTTYLLVTAVCLQLRLQYVKISRRQNQGIATQPLEKNCSYS